MSFARKTYAAVRWTTLSALFRAGLQLVQLAILTRMLAPEDYGLMAMVIAVLGFTALFADAGTNSAFVQRQNITDGERTSLYWLNVGASFTLMLFAILLSPLIARGMDEPRIVPLLMVAASTLLLSALGQQVTVFAEKQLDLRPVVVLEISAAILGFGTAVFAAWAGWGVWALVAGSLINTGATTAGAWLFMSKGWRPGCHFRWAEVRPFLGFGGALVANNFVNYVNSSIDLILGGRLLGAAQLGLYSVPRNLVLQVQMMINPVITRVGFPMIAQMQHDIPRVRAIYLKTLNMTASVNAPVHLAIAFFAPEIVSLLLGEKWQEVVPLLQILALWGLFRSMGNPVGSLLLGMGRAGLALKWNLALTAVVLPVLWLGAQWDILGMAWAMAGLMVTLFVPGWYILVRPLCGAGLSEYSIAALRPIILALASMIPAYLISDNLDGDMNRLLAAMPIAAVFYVALSYKANSEWFAAMKELLWHRPS